jgi:ABC-2 type transport system ATP-binding protein
VTIRFGLPDGIAPDELPVPIDSVSEGRVEIRTEDELPVLHALTGWALDRNLRLLGLSVARVTLEDVYLMLTREER